MQGQRLLFFFALLALVFAQGQGNGNDKGNDKGGCCFYSSINYEEDKKIACTNQPFRKEDLPNKDGIRSFHCTESFAAQVFDRNGNVMEEASCGDEVGETTEPINYHNITIAECLQRRCCFYTGKNKDGNEFCMFTDGALPEDLRESQRESKFAVGECTSEWSATLRSKGKTTVVECGVTLDLPASETYDSITLKKCPPARAVYEAVEETLEFSQADNFDQSVDAAFADNQVDAAVFDEASFASDNLDATFVDDNAFVDQAVDAFAGDNQVDAAYTDVFNAEDNFAVEQYDAAVMDSFDVQDDQFATENYDQAFAMDAFDQTFEDQAVFDNNEYVDYATNAQDSSFNAGSSVMGSLFALVAVVLAVVF